MNKNDAFMEERPPSRSQKKRESTALQQRGEELARLSPAVWKTFPLPQELAEALEEFRRSRGHEASRRQLQYIGRLMRELDDEDRDALLSALDEHGQTSSALLGRQKALEAARDALLDADPAARESALASVLAGNAALVPTRLRHLVDATLAERAKKRPPKYARELFRYLRDSANDTW